MEPNRFALKARLIEEIQMPDTIRASHILLMYTGSMRSTASRSQDEAESLINQIKSELDDGGNFAELARTHSDCPSGSEGGDLGVFGQGMMVPEFEQVAFDLNVGDVSDVVDTPFGYHIIRRSA